MLELDTWDGRSVDADISQAATGRLVDIGLAEVPDRLPAVAKTCPQPAPGDRVTAVGFPLGGQLTLSPGKVIGYRDGRTLTSDIAFEGDVMELSVHVNHGNSGGPLLDAQGRVVGIICAGEPGSYEDYARVAYAFRWPRYAAF